MDLHIQVNALHIIMGEFQFLKCFYSELTELIARKVGVKSCKVLLGKFANNETNVQLMDQVRCQDVYIIQTGLHTLNLNK